MKVRKSADIPWKVVGDGIEMKVLAHGGNLMMTMVKFEVGKTAPLHSHPHEQISYILSGKFIYRLGKEEFTMNEGDSIYVPPNAEHNVTSLECGVILDVFTPIRSDFL